ncbi:MAG: undecaprenyl-diphosphate phosphatase [Collinsella aerofaciens]
MDEFIKLNVTEEFWNMFLVVIQLGAILAVCVLFIRDLLPFGFGKTRQECRSTWSLWGKIIVGCLPAAIIGIPLDDFMEEHLNAWLLPPPSSTASIERWRAASRRARGCRCWCRAVGPGLAFRPLRCRAHRGWRLRFHHHARLSYKTAFGIGCFRCSLIPVPAFRSTIIGGLLLGTAPVAAKLPSSWRFPPFGASFPPVKFFLKGGVFDPSGVAILASVVVIIASPRQVVMLSVVTTYGVCIYRIVLGVAVGVLPL